MGNPHKESKVTLTASCNTEYVDYAWNKFTSGFKTKMDHSKPCIVVRLKSISPEESIEELREEVLEFKLLFKQMLRT